MRLHTRLYKFSLTQEVTIRIGLSVLFVTFTHQLQWQSLRMVTSEAILRTSLAMGMSVFRVSADTINVNGTFFQFVPPVPSSTFSWQQFRLYGICKRPPLEI